MKLNKIKKSAKLFFILLIMCVFFKCVIAIDLNFTAYGIAISTIGTSSVYAIDVDSDGDTDILASHYDNDKVEWYENDGSENFTSHTITISVDGPESVFAIDLDSDGDIDVLSASINDDKIAWYENNGYENFTVHNIPTQTLNVAQLIFAIDLDKDGNIDVLSAGMYDKTIAWYENNGAETFTSHNITTSANYPKSVFAIDVDSDGDIDVLSASYNGDKIAWYENNGAETFTAHNITISADGAYSVFAIDVDSDGDIDVLSASYNDDKIAWYENDGSETFTSHTITTSADGADSVFAIDLDSDGDIDVLSASYNDDKIAWYENNGAETFTSHIITNLWQQADFANSVFAIDMDGDGDIDVLSSSGVDDKIMWYRNSMAGCYDSDGQNWLIKGYVKLTYNYSFTFDDYCESSSVAYDYICSGGYVDKLSKNCSDYGIGSTCSDGACVNVTNITCSDSDGTNYLNKGYVNYLNVTYWDTCSKDPPYNITGSNDLAEMICTGGVLDTDIKNCTDYGLEYSCSDGECVLLPSPPNCVDSDGTNYLNKGYVNYLNVTYWDTCSKDPPYSIPGSNDLAEMICTEGVLDTDLKNCSDYGSEYICDNGICTENQRPTITKVEHFFNPTGYPDIYEHKNFYKVNTNITYNITAIDTESDEIYVAVDCDNSFGPPYVSSWGTGPSSYTQECNYTTPGTYTAKVFAIDPVYHGWDDYSVYQTMKINITECESASDCLPGQDCSVIGGCFNLSNITFCNDTDYGVNKEIPGILTTNLQTKYDVCGSYSAVTEYYCDNESDVGYYATLVGCEDYQYCYENATGPDYCRELTCYDSDGINYLLKGYVNKSRTVLSWDYCSNSSNLIEYICSANNISSIMKNCTDYGLEYSCSDGKCVLLPSFNCTDSDGLNYFNNGYVLDSQYPNFTFWDDCEDNITLWEKFCGEDGMDVIDRNCNYYGSQYICYNGMCIEQPTNCTDSDGVDYYTKGYATDVTTGTTYWDFCYNGVTVNEYICSGEEVDSILQDCSYSFYFNYTCSDGKCVYTEGCSDSDLGVDYFTKGTVTLTSGLTFTDYCLTVQGNDNYVAEYYCEDGEVKLIANRQCDYDCVDGACKLITPTNPEESDLDSPWYRDEEGTLKFDRTKCEGWKSYIMCAGWKYGVKQAATGTSWVFTGIHFLYFLVFIIIIIIVGPLIVEFFKPRDK